MRSVAAVIRFPDRGESQTALKAILLGGLDKELGRVESNARLTLKEALAAPAYELEVVFGGSPPKRVAARLLLPDLLERRIVAALATLPAAEAEAFDLNGLLMQLAAKHAISAMADGEPMPLHLGISFDIFATRIATERFFAVCAQIDRRITERLTLLLSALPPGLPQSRLQDCVNRLRPNCCAVGYEVDQLMTLPSLRLENGFNPVVVLPAAACIACKPAALRDLFGSLHSRRARVMVRGAASGRNAAAFRSLGADMISMRGSPA